MNANCQIWHSAQDHSVVHTLSLINVAVAATTALSDLHQLKHLIMQAFPCLLEFPNLSVVMMKMVNSSCRSHC